MLGVPSPPEGEEMDHSKTTTSGSSGLSTLGALLPGMGVAGTYEHASTGSGQASIQADVEEDGEKEEEEGDRTEDRGESGGSSEPRLFRITSVGSSEFSISGPPVNRPIIHIQGESDSEGSPLFPRMSATEKRRQRELAGASLPPLLTQQKDSPSKHRRGTSNETPAGYGAIPVNLQADSGSRSPSPQGRRKLRKTISGD